jgi:hypothetical protein
MISHSVPAGASLEAKARTSDGTSQRNPNGARKALRVADAP